MTIIRCTKDDVNKINKIMTSDEIYPFICDDFCLPANLYTVEPLIDICHILMPTEHSVIIFIPVNGITWDVHFNVLKAGRGEAIRKVTNSVFEYAFKKIPNCKKLICKIAVIHENIIQYAKECGFTIEGRITRSFQKDGILHDEIVLGLREDIWLQQQ